MQCYSVELLPSCSTIQLLSQVGLFVGCCLNVVMSDTSFCLLQSTSNYHARRFGVRAAMPGFIAKKLCPHLVIVPLNFDKYRAVSAQVTPRQIRITRYCLAVAHPHHRLHYAVYQTNAKYQNHTKQWTQLIDEIHYLLVGLVFLCKVREVFAEYDPNFLPLSLDEAYLDMTEHLEQRATWPECRRTYSSSSSSSRTEGQSLLVDSVAKERGWSVNIMSVSAT